MQLANNGRRLIFIGNNDMGHAIVLLICDRITTRQRNSGFRIVVFDNHNSYHLSRMWELWFFFFL